MSSKERTVSQLWILVLCYSVWVNGESLTLTGGITRAIVCGVQKIAIEKVFYGGSDPGSSCVKTNAFHDVVINCFKKASCTLNTILLNNPDPCPGINKKLDVTYSCVQDEHILDNCQAVDTKLEVGKPLFVVSPNYPELYASGLECEVTVNPPDLMFRSDLKVELLFMQMEHRVNTDGCYDKLVLQEPGNPAKTFEYCGTSPEHSGNPVSLTMEKAKFTTITDQMSNQIGFVVKITNIAWTRSCPLPHSCLNGATCIQSDSGTNKFCRCVTGYSGITCAEGTTETNICNPNPCKNNGHCIVESSATYRCDCVIGWIGQRCEVSQINPCVSKPCQNNGACVRKTDTTFTCICPAGYSGNLCQSRQNQILEKCIPCRNGGTCTVTELGPICTCDIGFYGPRCESYGPDNCHINACKNGQCVDDNDGYRCVCSYGYQGKHCTEATGSTSGSGIPVASIMVMFVVFLINNHLP